MEHDIIVVSPDNSVGNRNTVILGTFARALRNPAYRSRMVAAMTAPIRRNLDYQGLARKVFVVEQLPSGAVTNYDKEPE